MTNNVHASRIFRDPRHLAAFGFGSGLSPWAPGTAGTLVAVPLFYSLSSLPIMAYFFVVLGMMVLGVWLCGWSARDLGVHDHPGIVWDEIVGYLVTMAGAPAHWAAMLIGFCLFRLFDIWKPWPIGRVDQGLSGGMGIMLDDVLAGVFAAVWLQLTSLFLPAW